MRRYWVDPECIQNEEVHFTGDIYHHICDVCRMQLGSRFEVLTEGGHAFLVELERMQTGKRPHAIARILEKRQVAPLREPYIHLAVGLSRFPTMDAIVEKAVELGVYEVHPFFSDFSFIRTEDKISPAKLARWEKIVLSATQQSGRGDRMRVQKPAPLKKIFDNMNRKANAMGLFAYEGEGEWHLSQAVAEMKHSKPKEVWIFVGSEGGFSEQEVHWLRDQGLKPTTLGSQVLRVETACVTLVSIIKYEFD